MSKTRRILIIGLTERMGGVETFIYNTTIFSDKSKYKYDYLVHGAEQCVYENEINEFYNDGEKHIHFISRIKDNPLLCIVQLFKFYKKNGKKYDKIHLHTGSTFEIAYIFPFSFWYGIEVISHSHSANERAILTNKLFRPIMNWTTKKYLACSKVAAKWLFGKNNVNKTQIINNGIDINKYKFSVEKREKVRGFYGLKNEFVIGHVGRFSSEKNHIFILNIFRNIFMMNNNARLLLVGDGPDIEEIKSKAKDLHIFEKVIFAGKQSNTDEYYSAFDVFLMPSLFEGLPIVGIEAQCSGLECFFSDQIDKQILITDKAHMLPLDLTAEEWANRILGIQTDEERMAYCHIIEEKGYSIRDTVKKIERIYGL